MVRMAPVIDESSSANSHVVSRLAISIAHPDQAVAARSAFIVLAHTNREIVQKLPRDEAFISKLSE
jgi:hypothetical protein